MSLSMTYLTQFGEKIHLKLSSFIADRLVSVLNTRFQFLKCCGDHVFRSCMESGGGTETAISSKHLLLLQNLGLLVRQQRESLHQCLLGLTQLHELSLQKFLLGLLKLKVMQQNIVGSELRLRN